MEKKPNYSWLTNLLNLCRWESEKSAPNDTSTISVTSNTTLSSFLISKNCERLLESLGICVAGFLYLDNDTKTVNYKFFFDAINTSSDSTYMIEYQKYGWGYGNDSKHDELKKVVDSLFYIHRRHQNPFNEQKSFNDPEYLIDLPIYPTIKDRRIVKNKAPDDYIRKKFGIHYVPYGELTAFLLMWRRLLRRIQYAYNIYGIDEGNAQQANTNLWLPVNKWGNIQSFESELAKVAASTKESHEYLEHPKQLRDFIEEQENNSTWEIDLKAMLLINDKGFIGSAYQPLKCFVTKLQQPLLTCLFQGSECDPKMLENIADSLLNLEVTCNLGVEVSDIDILLKAINDLHKISRFPILPYYYWNGFSKRERTHAAIPIWRSEIAPLTSPIQTTIVGVAVVDLRPLDIIDKTYYTKKQTKAFETVRLRNIISTIRIISQRQVDSFFYNEIQGGKIETDTAQKATGYFSHDQRNSIISLKSCLLGIDESLKLDDNAKLRIAGKMTDDLLNRTDKFSCLSLLAKKQNFGLINEQIAIAQAGDCISIEAIAIQELARVLIHKVISQSNTRTTALTWLHQRNINFIDFIKEWPQSEKYINEYIKYSGRSLSTPYIVPQDTSSATFPIGVVYSALSLIFHEFIENFFRHEFKKHQTPMNTPLIVISSEVNNEEYNCYDLTFSIGQSNTDPTSIKTITRSTGLSTLKHWAKSIGVNIPEKEFEEIEINGSKSPKILPFWELSENGDKMCVWKLEHVKLIETGEKK